jgi:hypothetical protein
MPGKIPPFGLKLLMVPMIPWKEIGITGLRRRKTWRGETGLCPKDV